MIPVPSGREIRSGQTSVYDETFEAGMFHMA